MPPVCHNGREIERSQVDDYPCWDSSKSGPLSVHVQQVDLGQARPGLAEVIPVTIQPSCHRLSLEILELPLRRSGVMNAFSGEKVPSNRI